MQEPIHILHLEDDPLDAELIHTTLDSTGLLFNITRVQTSQEFRDTLQRGGFELIMADFKLPNYDGMSAMRLVREQYPDIPFIFVSGTMGEDAAIQALTEGATDYVLKQKLSRLALAVSRALRDAENRAELRQVEEKLRQSEQKYRSFVEESSEGFVLIDEQGTIIEWNHTSEKMTGLLAYQTIGKAYWDVQYEILPPELRTPERYERTKQNVLDALQTGKSLFFNIVIEGEVVKQGGERLFVHLTIFPIKTEKGYRIGSVTSDITESKRAEEKICKLNQELEKRVSERTSQLEVANKELEAFAYSVSHDLRSPLRAIRGFIGLLQENMADSPDAECQQFLTTISNSAQHMSTLIDDLLSFSRMGRAEMSNRRVDLTSLVQDVIQELEPESIDRSIHWQIASLPEVTGDRAMLRIVLMNLISNALKFTRPCPHAEIEIGCIPDTEPVIFVRDNGVGFDMNCVDKLFGVFQRLHRADEFEGTGIGLANVHRIINRHGGRTWAEGEVDHGATFYFSLPQANRET